MLIVQFRGKYPMITAAIFLFLNIIIIFKASVFLMVAGHLYTALFLIFPFIFISEIFLASIDYLHQNKHKRRDLNG